MKNNKEIPKLRIDSETYEKMIKVLETLNKNPLIEITLPVFRRMALKDFTNRVIEKGGVDISIRE